MSIVSFAKERVAICGLASGKQTPRVVARHAPFLLVALVAIALLTVNVGSPWRGIHEDNGSAFQSIAINHIRYGLARTKGQDLLDYEARQHLTPAGMSEDAEFSYYRFGPVHLEVYGDHPPLLGLTIAASFLTFGYHYWAERLVPIAYSLAGLALFYLIALRLFDVGVALFASALYAVSPMFAYFGRNVAHESAVLCWALLLLLAYIHYREEGGRRWLVVVAVAVVIGGGYGWPLFYFAPLLLAVDWLRERRLDKRLALATLAPAAGTLALVLAQITWARNGNLAPLADMLVFRTSGSGQNGPVTLGVWWDTILHHNAAGFGPLSGVAIPTAAAFLVLRLRREGFSLRLACLAVCGLWAVSHVLLFRNGAYIHAYWQFYWLPFSALAIGWAVVSLVRRLVGRPELRALALVAIAAAALHLNLPSIQAYYATAHLGFHPPLLPWL